MTCLEPNARRSAGSRCIWLWAFHLSCCCLRFTHLGSNIVSHLCDSHQQLRSRGRVGVARRSLGSALHDAWSGPQQSGGPLLASLLRWTWEVQDMAQGHAAHSNALSQRGIRLHTHRIYAYVYVYTCRHAPGLLVTLCFLLYQDRGCSLWGQNACCCWVLGGLSWKLPCSGLGASLLEAA